MGRSFSLPATADTDVTRADAADTFDVDVLVIGAGVAGTQAAMAAAAAGASVLVVDKRRPEPATAEPFGRARGARRPRWLPGHAALELLLDGDGAVRGAAGVHGPDEVAWRAHAAAVVLATGAEAADGLLMAAEAGAALADLDARGGVLVHDEAGNTGVAGLLVVGAAAAPSRFEGEAVPCGTPVQAMLAGRRAGAAAAVLAREPATPGALRGAGEVALRGQGHQAVDPRALLAALQAVAGPAADSAALARLDALWHFLRRAAPAPRGARRVTREVAASLARSRWQLASRLARQAAPRDAEFIVCRGVDALWARPGAWPAPVASSAGTPAASSAAAAPTPALAALPLFGRPPGAAALRPLAYAR